MDTIFKIKYPNLLEDELTEEDYTQGGLGVNLSYGRGRAKSSNKLIRVQEESDADSLPGAGESQLYGG